MSTEMTDAEKREIYKRFDATELKLIRILGILESDEKIKEKGLVEKVSLINKSLNELLTREKVYKAKATTWGVIGGAIGTAIIWIAKALLTKIFMI